MVLQENKTRQLESFGYKLLFTKDIWPDIKAKTISANTNLPLKRVQKYLDWNKEYKVFTFKAVFDFITWGAPTLFLLTKPKKPDLLLTSEKLKKIKCITSVELLFGKNPQLLLRLKISARRDKLVLDKILLNISQYVEVLDVIKTEKTFFENRIVYAGKNIKPVKIDFVDRKIVSILTKDSTTTLKSIGEKLKISDVAVHKRISKLKESKILRGHTVKLSWIPETPQLNYFCRVRTNPKNILELTNSIISSRNKNNLIIPYVCGVIGKHNLLFNLQVSNIQTFNIFFKKIHRNFEIQDFEINPLVRI